MIQKVTKEIDEHAKKGGRHCTFCGATSKTFHARAPRGGKYKNCSLWYWVEGERWQCRKCYQRGTKQLSRERAYAADPIGFMLKKEAANQKRAERKRADYFKINTHRRIIFDATYHKITRFEPNKKAKAKKFPLTYKELVSNRLAERNYERLFNQWEKSGFDVDLTPILSRISFPHPYSKRNVRWVTWNSIGHPKSLSIKEEQARQELLKSHAEFRKNLRQRAEEAVCAFSPEELAELKKKMEEETDNGEK